MASVDEDDHGNNDKIYLTAVSGSDDLNVSNNNSNCTKKIEVGNFLISLHHDDLSVIFIKHEFVSRVTWWILKWLQVFTGTNSFKSLVTDNEGLHIVCDEQSAGIITALIDDETFKVDKQVWKALSGKNKIVLLCY